MNEHIPNLVRGSLEQIRKHTEVKPYFVEVLGNAFAVLPGVFSPVYFEDTEFFAKNVPADEEDIFLEVGSGTGIVSASLAIRNGIAGATATDINPEAVRNTRINFELHGMVGNVSRGNVYGALSPFPYDKVFWNVPFGLEHPDGKRDLTDLEKSVIDIDYHAVKRYFDDSHLYVSPRRGRLFVGFSREIGRYDVLEAVADRSGFKLESVARSEPTGTHNPEGPATFEVLEAIRK